LKNASKNKIFKVQQAGSEALKFWNALKQDPETENSQLEIPKLASQQYNILKDKPELGQVNSFEIFIEKLFFFRY